jgi:hypothetical protein
MVKRRKRKTKMWPRVWPSSSLSGESSFPCSAEASWALSFWSLHPLVRRVVTMLRPVCFCAVEGGRYVRLDLCREGVMWHSCRYPVIVEVWTSLWWNDRGHVGSKRGFHTPVYCARSCPSHRRERVPRLGGRGFPSCQMTPRVLGARWKLPPEVPVSPETFPQGSGETEVDSWL